MRCCEWRPDVKGWHLPRRYWQPHGAIDAGQRCPGRLRRLQTAQKCNIAVDALEQLLALWVTAVDQQDRAQVGALAKAVQASTGQSVQLAFVDQGYTGDKPTQAAARHGIQFGGRKLPTAKRGFVLLSRRRVVERSFAWAALFRRLAVSRQDVVLQM